MKKNVAWIADEVGGGDTESASGIGMGDNRKFGGTEFSCLSFFCLIE